jgi:hypothetical protein
LSENKSLAGSQAHTRDQTGRARPVEAHVAPYNSGKGPLPFCSAILGPRNFPASVETTTRLRFPLWKPSVEIDLSMESALKRHVRLVYQQANQNQRRNGKIARYFSLDAGTISPTRG